MVAETPEQVHQSGHEGGDQRLRDQCLVDQIHGIGIDADEGDRLAHGAWHGVPGR